jgi:SAM-dependent methyltransferase
VEEYYWDNKIEYLRKTRDAYYNDDYLEFLVKSVWRLNQPISIIDYGCGYGYLGLKLLPLLPKGTKYTGIDKGNQLISEARAVFGTLPYETEFIVGDITEAELECKYDVALCHAFLMHMTDPILVLKKMVDSVVDQGRIICFEANWISAMANTYLAGVDQSKITDLGILQKLYEDDAKRNGKDGNIGIKLPRYFSQLGLKDIGCRVSDKVNFLDSNVDQSLKQKMCTSFCEDGFGADPGEQDIFVRRLIDRGMSFEDAQRQYQTEKLLASLFNIQSDLVSAATMKITFGTVCRGEAKG